MDRWTRGPGALHPPIRRSLGCSAATSRKLNGDTSLHMRKAAARPCRVSLGLSRFRGKDRILGWRLKVSGGVQTAPGLPPGRESHLYVRLKWSQRSLAGVSVYRRLRGAWWGSGLGPGVVGTPAGWGVASPFKGSKGSGGAAGLPQSQTPGDPTGS